MQNHHETDPKQQCDRDANDATKSFDAESYDFDTVWPGPKTSFVGPIAATVARTLKRSNANHPLLPIVTRVYW